MTFPTDSAIFVWLYRIWGNKETIKAMQGLNDWMSAMVGSMEMIAPEVSEPFHFFFFHLFMFHLSLNYHQNLSSHSSSFHGQPQPVVNK